MSSRFVDVSLLQTTGGFPNAIANNLIQKPSVPIHLIKRINIDESKCALKCGFLIERTHCLNILLTSQCKHEEILDCVMDIIMEVPLGQWRPFVQLQSTTQDEKLNIINACGILIRNATLDPSTLLYLSNRDIFWDCLHRLCCFEFQDQRRDATVILSQMSPYIQCKNSETGPLNNLQIECFFQTVIDSIDSISCFRVLSKMVSFYENRAALMNLSESTITLFFEWITSHMSPFNPVSFHLIITLSTSLTDDIPEEWAIWSTCLSILDETIHWDSPLLLSKTFNRQVCLELLQIAKQAVDLQIFIYNSPLFIKQRLLEPVVYLLMEHIHLMGYKSIGIMKHLIENHGSTRSVFVSIQSSLMSLVMIPDQFSSNYERGDSFVDNVVNISKGACEILSYL